MTCSRTEPYSKIGEGLGRVTVEERADWASVLSEFVLGIAGAPATRRRADASCDRARCPDGRARPGRLFPSGGVIPDSCHHRCCATVADGKALPCGASDIQLTGCCTVEDHVAHRDGVFRVIGGIWRRRDGNSGAVETLAAGDGRRAAPEPDSKISSNEAELLPAARGGRASSGAPSSSAIQPKAKLLCGA